MDNETTNIIFTRDGNYAYKLRNKLNSIEIKTDYVRDTEALLFFMFKNNKGIIFLDLKYARFLPIIKEYSLHQFSRNFCFIYLTDNKNCEVEFDNKLIFVTDYENVLQTVTLANEALNRREKLRFVIPENFIDNCLIDILSTLNISNKHSGYDLIKDAIKILVNKQTKTLTLMKEVYIELGKMHGKEPANVEKSIRLALNKAEEKNPENFEKVFNNCKISNTVLLNSIAENIKNSYYNSSEYKEKFNSIN
ncbi:MAG: sporulation initiation factor Spo0A C-terminal domain-containing protein [Christensenellales bacterium]